MLGLGAYGSSSEDEGNVPQPSHKSKQHENEHSRQIKDQENERIRPSSIHSTEDVSGPLMGPFQPSEQLNSTEEASSLSHQPVTLAAQRSLMRDMTLPPYPNLDIPPSPPGSPPPASSQKFTHFLSLKKQDIHFNEKLASSSSLKNPSLFSSLRQHAGLEEMSQYGTSLDHSIWDVTSLPHWGYKEELQRAQQEIRSKITEKKGLTPRASVDFVGASKEMNRHDNPAGRTVKPSAVEHLMTDLDKEESDVLGQGRR
ncbi:hypothetical protein CIHG_06394 [Coccidioides immitis H538.4]|uniref:Uncharacterized protein n=3 Tax=Coccidioides immitis TaxID=5501 RepID=A0A0J8R7N0_COCIT|nr:hypothetical protein CIRG_10206 [Coccidioides immitis RMSCC 2394]KMU80876.1 hypothetical protein CISG_08547 [Coccidioides immitis RMSCC 3703]KMU88726.1 hypothetical protein CIHG_06394 [Coccidioides immitis H538.4]